MIMWIQTAFVNLSEVVYQQAASPHKMPAATFAALEEGLRYLEIVRRIFDLRATSGKESEDRHTANKIWWDLEIGAQDVMRDESGVKRFCRICSYP